MAANVDWATYNDSLKKRGSITFWMSDDAIQNWYATPTGQQGAQPTYSDLAIETALSLRLIFKQALRQTEGLVNSIFELMRLDLQSPDYSTLSRRGAVIDLPTISSESDCEENLFVVIDSTGLKIFGAGEWNETKHGLSKRRQWRKLHLTVNAKTLEIVEASLTDNNVVDSTEAENHLEKIKNPIDIFMGDGAYDCQKIYDAVENSDDGGIHSVIIPPRSNAVFSDTFSDNPTQRDQHIDFIDKHGRPAWEINNHYSKRLLAENAMGRFKGIIGSTVRARGFESQKREAMLGCRILNQMTKLGTPTTLLKKAS